MIQADDTRPGSTPKHTFPNTALRIARYLSVRVATIALTIFVGIGRCSNKGIWHR